ncbi:hypothetical protein R6Q57_011058 [Mikania cordata]
MKNTAENCSIVAVLIATVAFAAAYTVPGGLTMQIISVSMMMVAFAATLILTINRSQNWTNVLLYIISFFPVTIYGYFYIHLYKLLINAFCEKLWTVKEVIFPACVAANNGTLTYVCEL